MNTLRKKIFPIAFVLVNILFVFNGFAQGGTQRIEGVVIDASNGEALYGASLAIKGTSVGTVSNLNGEFTVNGVPEGMQILQLRYIGYQSVDTLISVVSSNNQKLTLTINPSVIMGQEVVVSVQRKGQVAAINQQRTNDAISNIVSSDKIREVPDVTAAESIGRLPGVSIQRSAGEGNKVVVRGLDPKYTNIKIDGVRLTGTGGDRSVGLNNIAPEMLDGIELTKSLTADKEADAIAGEINLRTRVAESGFKIDGTALGTYSGLQKNINGYRFSLNAGNRFFEDKLGILFNVGSNEFTRTNQSISNSYGFEQVDPDAAAGLPAYSKVFYNSSNINVNTTTRRRTNGNLTLDYKNHFMQVKFRNNLNYMTDNYENRNNTFAAAQNNIFKYNISDGKPITFGRLHALNTIFNIGSSSLYVDASYIDTKHDNQVDKYNFEDKQAWGKENAATRNDLYGQFAKDAIKEYYDISQINYAYLLNNTRDTIESRDQTYTARLDWKVPYTLGKKISGYLKIGGMHSTKKRKADNEAIESYYHGGIGGDRADRVYDKNPDFLRPRDIPGYTQNVGIPAVNFEDVGYDYGELLKGEHTLGWSADLDKLKEVHNYNNFTKENQQYYRLGISSSANDYETTESYNAAYIMAQIKLGRNIMILPGIRYEHMQTQYMSSWVKENPFDPTGVRIGWPKPVELKNRKNGNWFPSVNIKYDIFKWMDIRAAYFKSTTRPDYSKLSPGVIVDQYGSNLRMNNPYLMPGTADNYEFGVSIYTSKIGLFTANVFYKEMTNLLGSIGNYNPKDFSEMVGAPQVLLDQLSQHVNDSTLVPQEFLIKANGKPSDVQINSYPFNNPDKAYIKGLELSWQTSFWYLPGLLKGLVLDLNVTFIQSEATYPYIKKEREKRPNPNGLPIPYFVNVPYYGSDTRQMNSQPGTIYNARVGYDYKGFSTRLSFRYEQQNILEDNKVHNFLRYRDDLFRMDLNLNQKITKNLTFTLDIANLNNTYENVIINEIPANERREKEMPGDVLSKQLYGVQAQIGLRFKFL